MITPTRILLVALLLLASLRGNANTVYLNDNKQLTKGAAIMLALKNPGAKILKVQTSFVKLNPVTANLIKASDAKLTDIPKL